MQKSKIPQWVMCALLCIAQGAPSLLRAGDSEPTKLLSTEAGYLDFQCVHVATYPGAYHKMIGLFSDYQCFELEDGSRWGVKKADLIKGWEKSDSLAITQNHNKISLYKYALVNVDLQLAVPITLIREPTPVQKTCFFIKEIDLINDIITLNDDTRWIIHSSDHGVLNKFNEHDRIIVSVNSEDKGDKSPYLLIDTSKNNASSVRAHML